MFILKSNVQALELEMLKAEIQNRLTTKLPRLKS